MTIFRSIFRRIAPVLIGPSSRGFAWFPALVVGLLASGVRSAPALSDQAPAIFDPVDRWEDRAWQGEREKSRNRFLTIPPKEKKAALWVFLHESGMLGCAPATGDLDSLADPPLSENEAIVGREGLYNNQGVKTFVALPTENDPAFRRNLADLFDYFKKGIRHDPQFVPFYYNLGVITLRQKEYRKARKYFQKAVWLQPDLWTTHLALGKALEKLGRKDEAPVAFRKAAELNPYDYQALIALGDFNFSEKLYTRAARYYNRVLKLSPDYPDALSGLGKIAYKRKNYFEASLIFRRVKYETLSGIPLPYKKEVHYYHGRALSEMGQYKRALAEYNRLLQFPQDPFFTEVPYTSVQRLRDIAQRFSLFEQN